MDDGSLASEIPDILKKKKLPVSARKAELKPKSNESDYQRIFNKRFPCHLYNTSLFLEKTSHQVNITPSDNHTKNKKKQIFSKRSYDTPPKQSAFIQTNNLFILLKKRNTTKLYEVTTTGSNTKITQNHSKYAEIDPKLFRRQLVNMDNNNVNKNIRCNSINGVTNCNPVYDSCNCCECGQVLATRPKTPSSKELYHNKSRVKIFGKLGLNKDDKYVLKCSATVNGEPITTNFYNTLQSISQPVEQCNEKNSTAKCDCFVQTSTTIRNQRTGCRVKNATLQFCNSNCNDQIIQSDVSKYNYCEQNIQTSPVGPLVIISVYPNENQSPSDLVQINNISRPSIGNSNMFENENYGITAQTSSDQRNSAVRKKKKFNRDISKEKNNKKQVQRGRKRDFSPQRDSRKTSKSPDRKTDENKSRHIQIGKGINNNRIQMNDSNPEMKKFNVNKGKKKHSRLITQSTNGTITQTSNQTETKQNNNQNYTICKGKCNNNLVEESEIDLIKFKKDLIDSFTCQLKTNQNLTDNLTKKGYSNISINIDGERDRHELILYHDGLMTDLTINKTLKDKGTQANDFNSSRKHFKSIDAETGSNYSKENTFPYRPSGSRRLSTSPDYHPFNSEVKDVTMKVMQHRDSIEITHCREDHDHHSSSETKYENDIYEKTPDVTDLAFKRHFRGDKCQIPDPIERDREIRVLLGISRPTSKTQIGNKNRNMNMMKYDQPDHARCNKYNMFEENYKVITKQDEVDTKKAIPTQYELDMFQKFTKNKQHINITVMCLKRKMSIKFKKTLVKFLEKNCVNYHTRLNLPKAIESSHTAPTNVMKQVFSKSLSEISMIASMKNYSPEFWNNVSKLGDQEDNGDISTKVVDISEVNNSMTKMNHLLNEKILYITDTKLTSHECITEYERDFSKLDKGNLINYYDALEAADKINKNDTDKIQGIDNNRNTKLNYNIETKIEEAVQYSYDYVKSVTYFINATQSKRFKKRKARFTVHRHGARDCRSVLNCTQKKTFKSTTKWSFMSIKSNIENKKYMLKPKESSIGQGDWLDETYINVNQPLNCEGSDSSKESNLKVDFRTEPSDFAIQLKRKESFLKKVKKYFIAIKRTNKYTRSSSDLLTVYNERVPVHLYQMKTCLTPHLSPHVVECSSHSLKTELEDCNISVSTKKSLFNTVVRKLHCIWTSK